jgi:hypothetical protein
VLIDDVIRYNKGTLAFLLMWLLLFGHIVFVVGSPITMVIDTFLLPMIMLILLTRVSERHASRIAHFVHVVMAANAALGIWEFVDGTRVTPLIAQGIELVGDWRSTALLGHPLQNAAVTAIYSLVLIQGGGRDMPGPLRPIALVLQIVALVAFGGRAATALLVVFGSTAIVFQAIRIIRARRIGAAAVAALTFALTGGAVAVLLLVAGGFFDQFADRFVSDQGSAATRLSMFKLLSQMPLSALLFGASPDYVATLQRLNGIEFGIESFWIAMMANYGVLICVPFFAGLVAFFFDLKRATRAPSGWTILMFVAICSTSASLSGKTTAFAQFAVILLVLLRPIDEQMRGRRVAGAWLRR